MSWSIIAHTSKQSPNGAGGFSTDPIDTTGADLIIVVISDYTGQLNPDPADDVSGQSNSYTGLTQKTTASASSCRIYYSRPAHTGSGHTFTLPDNAHLVYATISVLAVSGSVASPFDAENGAQAQIVSSLAAGSVTPAEDNELVIVGAEFDTSGTVSVSGFTVIEQKDVSPGFAVGGALAYQIQTTATSVNPSVAYGATVTNAVAVVATFKAAAADDESSSSSSTSSKSSSSTSSVSSSSSSSASSLSSSSSSSSTSSASSSSTSSKSSSSTSSASSSSTSSASSLSSSTSSASSSSSSSSSSAVIVNSELMIIGDSNSYNTTGGTVPWVTTIGAILGSNWNITNYAGSGNSLHDGFATLSTTIALMEAVYNPAYVINVAALPIGSNDIYLGYKDGPGIYAQYRLFCGYVRAIGYKIVAHTMIYHGESADDAQRDIFNAMIRASWHEFSDALCDWRQDVRLQSNSDTNYFYEPAHMNTGGHALVATKESLAVANCQYPGFSPQSLRATPRSRARRRKV